MSFQKIVTTESTQTVTDPGNQYVFTYQPALSQISVAVYTDEGVSFAQTFNLGDIKFDPAAMISLRGIAADCVARILRDQVFAELPPDKLAPHPKVPDPDHGIPAAAVAPDQAFAAAEEIKVTK